MFVRCDWQLAEQRHSLSKSQRSPSKLGLQIIRQAALYFNKITAFIAGAQRSLLRAKGRRLRITEESHMQDDILLQLTFRQVLSVPN